MRKVALLRRITALRNATGQYQVVFSQDVTGCSYQATLGGPTTTLAVGQISAAQLSGVAGGVRVDTYDSAGAFANAPFFLAVFC